MRKLISRTALLACGAGVAMLAFGGPASAATTGAGVAVGNGTIAPGLTATGAPNQTVSFTGTVVGVGSPTSATGAYTCGTTGASDTIGSYAAGAGGGTLNCTAIAVASGTSAGPFTYVRTGGVVQVNGTLAGGPVPGAFTAVCVFEPAGAPTITSYQLQCVFEFGA
jgi:hypothetical protein